MHRRNKSVELLPCYFIALLTCCTFGGMELNRWERVQTVLRKEILYAESECRFGQDILTEGPLQLEAWFDFNGKKYGFRFIEIEKLK